MIKIQFLSRGARLRALAENRSLSFTRGIAEKSNALYNPTLLAGFLVMMCFLIAIMGLGFWLTPTHRSSYGVLAAVVAAVVD